MTRRDTTHRVRTVGGAACLSAAARRACAGFGLVVEVGGLRTREPIRADDATLDRVLASRVVLLSGPSGSGKSRRLEGIGAACLGRGRRVIVCDPAGLRADRGAMDAAWGGSTARTLAALSACGLGEPALWARPVAALSVGERARLALAQGAARARAGDVVVCDEFCSVLDRVSAASVARTASRWARRAGVTLVCAAAHEDVAGVLGADLVIDGGSGRVEPGGPPRPVRVRVEHGTRADYDRLSHLHYLGGRPATVVSVLRAVRETGEGDLLAGVLTVSMPTYNGVWRRQAWPGRYEGRDKRRSAARLNAELRCVSRVIVEPRSRGLGVASALVRAYLAEPMSPATEACALMGSVCPFFERAGMTGYDLPRAAHDARLEDALAHAGLAAHTILDGAGELPAFVEAELRRWAKHARVRVTESEGPGCGPGGGRGGELVEIARHAACRLSARGRAYAFGGVNSGGGSDAGGAIGC